jgi:hypothetical protein
MLSRKRFLALAGVSAGSFAAGCGGGDDDERAREARVASDREIVRFLLRLERVTTSFWDQVTARNALAEAGAGDLASEIARNEREHVSTLERYARRLSGEAPAPPRTNFAEVFAAGPQEVLATGATLANLSAAAHLGQANRIEDRNLLASVLAIHTVDGPPRRGDQPARRPRVRARLGLAGGRAARRRLRRADDDARRRRAPAAVRP